MTRQLEEAKARTRLQRFLSRADAVGDCALAYRPDLDELGRKITFTLIEATGTVRDITVNLAPESEVEQAIARMRPVLLKGDDIYWGNVISGMKLMTANAELARSRIRMVEEAWRAFPPTYMSFFSSNKDTGQEYSGSDSDLAMDWIYAEFVHADPKRAQAIAPTSTEMRRQATTLFAKDGVQHVVATARVIRELEHEGLLTLT